MQFGLDQVQKANFKFLLLTIWFFLLALRLKIKYHKTTSSTEQTRFSSHIHSIWAKADEHRLLLSIYLKRRMNERMRVHAYKRERERDGEGIREIENRELD